MLSICNGYALRSLVVQADPRMSQYFTYQISTSEPFCKKQAVGYRGRGIKVLPLRTAKNYVLFFLSFKPEVGQTVALHALPTAKNRAFLISAFGLLFSLFVQSGVRLEL